MLWRLSLTLMLRTTWMQVLPETTVCKIGDDLAIFLRGVAILVKSPGCHISWPLTLVWITHLKTIVLKFCEERAILWEQQRLQTDRQTPDALSLYSSFHVSAKDVKNAVIV